MFPLTACYSTFVGILHKWKHVWLILGGKVGGNQLLSLRITIWDTYMWLHTSVVHIAPQYSVLQIVQPFTYWQIPALSSTLVTTNTVAMNICLWFFIKTQAFKNILEPLLVHSKTERKVHGFPINLLLPHMHSLTQDQVSPEWGICYSRWIYTNTLSPEFKLGFTFGAVQSLGLDKCITTCIHHYYITRRSFAALKVLCVLPFHLFLSLNPWGQLTFYWLRSSASFKMSYRVLLSVTAVWKSSQLKCGCEISSDNSVSVSEFI